MCGLQTSNLVSEYILHTTLYYVPPFQAYDELLLLYVRSILNLISITFTPLRLFRLTVATNGRRSVASIFPPLLYICLCGQARCVLHPPFSSRRRNPNRVWPLLYPFRSTPPLIFAARRAASQSPLACLSVPSRPIFLSLHSPSFSFAAEWAKELGEINVNNTMKMIEIFVNADKAKILAEAATRWEFVNNVNHTKTPL